VLLERREKVKDHWAVDIVLDAEELEAKVDESRERMSFKEGGRQQSGDQKRVGEVQRTQDGQSFEEVL
jgi:hypothetical protein